MPSPTAPCSTSSSNPVTGTQARRLLTQLNPAEGPLFSTITEGQDNATADYNAGVLTLQKRLSQNFSIMSNYTYSHCIDTGETSAIVTTDAWRNDLSKEVGNCSFDHRHQFTLTGLVRSPTFKNGVAEKILGNWQLAPIIGYLSGDWLNVTTGTDTALVGTTTGQRPNQIGSTSTPQTPIGCNSATPPVCTLGIHYFNTAAFAAPTAGAGFTGNVINIGNGPVTVGPVGNLGRNTLNGPGIPSFDLALTRFFKITERQQIEVRVEAFNVFNLVRYYDPITAMNSPAFGESIAPTTTGTPGYSTPQDPRIMQFALKYTF